MTQTSYERFLVKENAVFQSFHVGCFIECYCFPFCFFLNGVFGQQSWRNAFLGSEAHAFQHFGLAYYTAVTVRELVEGFVVIPLQAGQPVADTEEGSVKPAIFSYKMVPRLMMACTFFTWFSFFQGRARGAGR